MGIERSHAIGHAASLALILSAIATAQPRNEGRPALHPPPGTAVVPRPPNAPGATGPQPSRIREPTPPSQQVQEYLTVARQDTARARQYLEVVEAEFRSYGARIDDLNAQADRLVNKPAAQLLRDDPGMSGTAQSIGKGLGWSISEKEKAYWVKEISSTRVRSTLTRIDEALRTASGYVKPTTYLDAKAAAQGEKTQLRNIDELERSLAGGLQLVFSNRLDLRQQQIRWELTLLDAQATLRTLQRWARWGDLSMPIAKDLSAARKAIDDAVPFGDVAGRHRLFEQRAPKVFADAMARYAPLCSNAAKQDALYVAEMGGRMQRVVDRFKEDHRRIVEEFRTVVTELYKDKSSGKAELSAAMLAWLQDIITDKNAGLSQQAGQGVLINWQVYVYDFGQWNEADGPVGAADRQTMLNTPSCLSWKDQMPADLDSRFPALSVELEDHRVSLSVNANKPQKAPAPVVGSEKVAQGGRYPDDGL